MILIRTDRRWDNDFLTLLDLLKKETLGRVVEFETHFDRWSPNQPAGWKGQQEPGTGVVYDLGSHLIDQVVHTFGMPKKVTGLIHRQRQPPSDLEDSCTVLLHYDGMLATAKASVMSLQVKQLRFKVRGDKGGYRKVRNESLSRLEFPPLIYTVPLGSAGAAAQGWHETRSPAIWQ